MNSEKIANYAPSLFKFSAKDEYLTFLHATTSQLHRQLWAVNLSTLKVGEVLSAPSNGGDTEENLSHEEKLRRERTRSYTLGITTYAPGGTSKKILVPMQGSLFVQDGINHIPGVSMVRCVFDASCHPGGGAIDPQVSPDGRWVAFVKDGELHAVSMEVEGGPVVQLTCGAASEGKTNGLADFIAQEEMDRFSGFWWSTDGRKIAFTEVDERHIPPYIITHQGKDDLSEPSQEEHRYPFAGQANPRVRLGVIDVEGLEALFTSSPRTWKESYQPRWLDEIGAGSGDDYYLARVNWLPDGSIGVQVQSRDQSVLRLLRVDPTTGTTTLLLQESSPHWINLHHLLFPLQNPIPALPHGGREESLPDTTPVPPSPMVTNGHHHDGGPSSPPSGQPAFSFLWGSERTGYMHLYLYSYYPAGKGGAHLVRTLTTGEWIVESIIGVDESRGLVYYMGTCDTPLERHLYASPLHQLRPPVRLTSLPGMHSVAMDHSHRRFVDVSSSVDYPCKTVLYAIPEVHSSTGLFWSDREKSLTASHPPRIIACSPLLEIHDALDRKVAAAREKLVVPEVFAFRPRDGTVDLYAALYRPNSALYGPGPYPTVVSVYGGPHVQKVNRSWGMTVDMMAQQLRDLGFAVAKCDNRGSARRGLAFEAAVKHNFGDLEVKDQEDMVKFLASQGVTDITRVGMFGWSYGGYMSIMSLCKASTTFTVAVAGAPVTSWDGYDTHYTERYMGTPMSNPDGYERSSVLANVGKLTGRLLLVHGQIDENVHFRHTARLINALVAARKNYDLVLFPDGRHSLRKAEDRAYLEYRLMDYLVQHLLLSGPALTISPVASNAGNSPGPVGLAFSTPVAVNAHL